MQNSSVRDCHRSSLYFWLPHQQELSVGNKGANTPWQRAWKNHLSRCGLFRCSIHCPSGLATPFLDLPLFCEDRDFYFINSPNKFINSQGLSLSSQLKRPMHALTHIYIYIYTQYMHIRSIIQHIPYIYIYIWYIYIYIYICIYIYA